MSESLSLVPIPATIKLPVRIQLITPDVSLSESNTCITGLLRVTPENIVVSPQTQFGNGISDEESENHSDNIEITYNSIVLHAVCKGSNDDESIMEVESNYDSENRNLTNLLQGPHIYCQILDNNPIAHLTGGSLKTKLQRYVVSRSDSPVNLTSMNQNMTNGRCKSILSNDDNEFDEDFDNDEEHFEADSTVELNIFPILNGTYMSDNNQLDTVQSVFKTMSEMSALHPDPNSESDDDSVNGNNCEENSNTNPALNSPSVTDEAVTGIETVTDSEYQTLDSATAISPEMLQRLFGGEGWVTAESLKAQNSDSQFDDVSDNDEAMEDA